MIYSFLITVKNLSHKSDCTYKLSLKFQVKLVLLIIFKTKHNISYKCDIYDLRSNLGT
jgi:hypothetical protein